MTIEPFIRVEPMVFTVLALHGIDINEAGAHFAETSDRVRSCPPNYRYRKGVKNNIWILRDFFPGTNILYKLTLVYQTPESQLEYDTKMREKYGKLGSVADYEPRIWVNVKLVPAKLTGKLLVPYKAAQKYLMAKAANIIIGDSIKPEPFMSREVKPPKRMFPKGFKGEDRPRKRHTHLYDEGKRRRRNVQKYSS